MRAGKLRHRVTLQSPSAVQNSYGEEVITWADERTVYASIEPIDGREYLEARAHTQDISHRIRLRYQPDKSLHPSWRIKEGSRIFLIESVINRMERDREWVVMARENV